MSPLVGGLECFVRLFKRDAAFRTERGLSGLMEHFAASWTGPNHVADDGVGNGPGLKVPQSKERSTPFFPIVCP